MKHSFKLATSLLKPQLFVSRYLSKDLLTYDYKQRFASTTESVRRVSKQHSTSTQIARNWSTEADPRRAAYYYQVGSEIMNGSKEGNRSQGLKLIEKAAKLGELSAQRWLAEAYLNGRGVELDKKKGFEWYCKLAEQNDAEGLYIVGCCYLEGRGVEQNLTKAVQHLEKAALQDHETAKILLKGLQVEKDPETKDSETLFEFACLYLLGKGVEQNFVRPFDLMKRAADLNHPSAQLWIGDAYLLGESAVEIDKKKCFEWYSKAAEQNLPQAQYLLCICYLEGLGVEKNYSKAVEFLEKAALQNHSEAQDLLGRMYFEGVYVQKDLKKSVEWYSKAADQDNPSALYTLYWLYSKGQGVEKNEATAFHFLQRAAHLNFPDAQDTLGFYFMQGSVELNVKSDKKSAFELFSKAAQQNNLRALFNLGYCYLFGKGVTEDRSKAVELFNKAALQGDSTAQFTLGTLYEAGEGVEKNEKLAFEWYSKAAQQNHSDALLALSRFYSAGKVVEFDLKKADEFFGRAKQIEEKGENEI